MSLSSSNSPENNIYDSKNQQLQAFFFLPVAFRENFKTKKPFVFCLYITNFWQNVVIKSRHFDLPI